MQKITPFLWFPDCAEQAAEFYASIFEHAAVTGTTRYGQAAAAASGMPEGSVMAVSLRLFGQDFTLLNGGPHFRFTEAVSFVVNCDTQAEVDRYWERLSDGGEPGQCGWLRDRYGVSWQIVPAELPAMLREPGSARVMQALLAMRKLDIAALRAACGRG